MKERLSERQIATLKRLAICCADGGQVTLPRDEREAMAPLWRRGLIAMWWRAIPEEGLRGPFYRPTDHGWMLIRALLAAPDPRKAAA